MKRAKKFSAAQAVGRSGRTGCSVSEYPLWAVMLAHTFEKSMKGPLGIPVHAPKEGPHGFIPLFFTREQAVAWAGGDEHIAELTPNVKLRGAAVLCRVPLERFVRQSLIGAVLHF